MNSRITTILLFIILTSFFLSSYTSKGKIVPLIEDVTCKDERNDFDNDLCLVDASSTTTVSPIYVDINAKGNNDGSSWIDAYTDLQVAIDDAEDGDGTTEIWVAKGDYVPSQTPDESSPSKNQSFHIKEDIQLYGGFQNADTTLLTANRSTSTLKGTFGGYYHIMITSNLTNAAIIDGFEFSSGGLGLRNRSPFQIDALTSVDSILEFDGNTYRFSEGGGMNNQNSSPTLRNCSWSGNISLNGGGMYNFNSSPIIDSCSFVGNQTSVIIDGYGSALYNKQSSPEISNSTFNGNANGVALYNEDCNPILTNCIISGNFNNKNRSDSWIAAFPIFADANEKEGCAVVNVRSNPEFYNIIIENNKNDSYGTAMVNIDSSPKIINATITRNGPSGVTDQPMPTYSGIITNLSTNLEANDFEGKKGNRKSQLNGFVIQNTIITNNGAPNALLGTDEIYNQTEAVKPTISHSLISRSGGSDNWNNNIGLDNGNNIDEPIAFYYPEPNFLGQIETPIPLEGSNIIDAGSSSLNDIATDVLSNERIVGASIDMGAIEYIPCPEFDSPAPSAEVTNSICTDLCNRPSTTGEILPPSTTCPKGSKITYRSSTSDRYFDYPPSYNSFADTVFTRCECLGNREKNSSLRTHAVTNRLDQPDLFFIGPNGNFFLNNESNRAGNVNNFYKINASTNAISEITLPLSNAPFFTHLREYFNFLQPEKTLMTSIRVNTELNLYNFDFTTNDFIEYNVNPSPDFNLNSGSFTQGTDGDIFFLNFLRDLYKIDTTTRDVTGPIATLSSSISNLTYSGDGNFYGTSSTPGTTITKIDGETYEETEINIIDSLEERHRLISPIVQRINYSPITKQFSFFFRPTRGLERLYVYKSDSTLSNFEFIVEAVNNEPISGSEFQLTDDDKFFFYQVFDYAIIELVNIQEIAEFSDSSFVVTDPDSCPSCPQLRNIDAPAAQIINSKCTAVGEDLGGGEVLAPTTNSCPEGSKLVYSLDNVTFVETLPTYVQDSVIEVFTRCDCESDFIPSDNCSVVTVSLVTSVTTEPGLSCPSEYPCVTNGERIVTITNSEELCPTEGCFGFFDCGDDLGVDYTLFTGEEGHIDSMHYFEGNSQLKLKYNYNENGGLISTDLARIYPEFDGEDCPFSPSTLTTLYCTPDSNGYPTKYRTGTGQTAINGTINVDSLGFILYTVTEKDSTHYYYTNGQLDSTISISQVTNANCRGCRKELVRTTLINYSPASVCGYRLKKPTTIGPLSSCEDCPSLVTAAPVAQTINSVCTSPATIPTGGLIQEPSSTCPIGSILKYSIDNMVFSETLPAYDQDSSITVYTRCDCDQLNSPVSMITTSPGQCIAPDFDIALEGPTSITEGTGINPTATYTITRNTSTGAATVDVVITPYYTSKVDAGDFLGATIGSQTVSFADTETSKNVTITINADDIAEGDESYAVHLKSVSSGGKYTSLPVYTTIIDDDQPSPGAAGPDILNQCGNTVSLGNQISDNEEGTWSIISGEGGTFNSASNLETTFSGQPGNIYILRWTDQSTTDDTRVSFMGDSDGDGVNECIDKCPLYDDNKDTDSDGAPDGCDCDPNNANDGELMLPRADATDRIIKDGLYQSSVIIKSSGTIKANTMVTQRAGQTLEFSFPFVAEALAQYEGYIGICTFNPDL